MKSLLLLVGISLLLSAQAAVSQQAPPPTTPATPQPGTGPTMSQPETAPPDREGRQPRTSGPSGRTPPARARREIDSTPSRHGGPTRQTLTLTANLLGGYDDNLTAGLGTGTGVAPTAMSSGYTTSLDGTLDYLRGNARHELRVSSTGIVMAYPGYIDDPSAGIVGGLDGKTTLGRSVTLVAGGRVGYEPLFNAFSGGVGTSLPPGSTPSTPVAGLFERRSLNSNSHLSLETRLSRRDSSTVSYSFGSQSFTDDESDEHMTQPFGTGDSRTHTAGAGYKRVVRANVRARADYQFSELAYEDRVKVAGPTSSQRIEGGADVEHTTSRGARLATWTVTAGAAKVEALTSTERLPYSAWLPMGSALFHVPFSPTAYVEATYRREFNLLQGVTDEVYATDMAAVIAGFGVAPRTKLRLVGSFANWKTPVASGVSDTFNVYGAGAQLVVPLTNWMGLTGAYYYYHHRYSNPTDLPEGFPSRYDRNAVRVGLTFFMPIVSPPVPRAGRP